MVNWYKGFRRKHLDNDDNFFFQSFYLFIIGYFLKDILKQHWL